METEVLRRKIGLVIDLVKNGETETLAERASIYSAARLLMDDVEAMIASPEFLDDADANTNVEYILSQARNFRSYVYYYLGFQDYTDIAPGNNENAISFGHKLLMFIKH